MQKTKKSKVMNTQKKKARVYKFGEPTKHITLRIPRTLEKPLRNFISERLRVYRKLSLKKQREQAKKQNP